MLVRVRTNVGVWRISPLSPTTATPLDLLAGIAQTRPHVVYQTPLSSDPGCLRPLIPTATLASQNILHGSMVYCNVDPASCADATALKASLSTNEDTAETKKQQPPVSQQNTKRVIAADGSIQLVHNPNASTKGDKNNGFRKGMLPLRDMKMQWTLQEFVDMDNQFVFKIKRQEESWVGKGEGGGCSLDSDSANDFQNYLRRFQFQRIRFGYLYGRFEDEEDPDSDKKKKPSFIFQDSDEKKTNKKAKKNKKVVVEAIYEPPQEADPDAAEGFVPLDDPMEEQVEKVAKMLGWTRVGWIFGHPPREKGFTMSAAEIIMAAELQLEAAGNVEPTPFVTVKVTVGDDGNASFEAFQVSLQCMEMVAEQAIEIGPNPGFCYVNDTFTAIQEGKESKTIENNFFLMVVPIVQHSSEMFVSQFPKANRDHDDRQQSHDEMKKQLSKSGSAGWTFVELLSDFNLLIYLCNFLDLNTDIAKICQSIVNRDIPLDDGYKLIIASMAGIDTAY